VTFVTTPNVPPPPPFSAQKRSGFVHALATRIFPSAVTTSASRRLAAARPNIFEKLPNPPPPRKPMTPTVVQPPPWTYRPAFVVTAS
jgi:hypothetical protein